MSIERRRLIVMGMVQGVGFRPFIYKLAQRLGLCGLVLNNGDQVLIEVQGSSFVLDEFILRIKTDKPSIATICDIKIEKLPITKINGFTIAKSTNASNPNSFLLPDLAVCSDCLKDITTPLNRRYRYPFTNCTNCGPRFTIIEALPYDRQNTSMKNFSMCSACCSEYNDPDDRRFHAQPNACHECGPKLAFWDDQGQTQALEDDALKLACNEIRQGKIVALKGLGGFHLLVDASNPEAINLLRTRKARQDKPFAVMFPTMISLKEHCLVTNLEENLLQSPESPIVVLKAKQFPSPNIAPHNPYLGAMLPYTPLHKLLLMDFDGPVIATSGNRSDELICIDEREALLDLKGIADCFLVHNRPIFRYVDDSIVRVVNDKRLLLRRSRGYSSTPIVVDRPLPAALAMGPQQKSTFAVAFDKNIFVSQHIGDLHTKKAVNCYATEIKRHLKLYGINPKIIVADCHDGYFSTRMALQHKKKLRLCQHHIAHVFSCMAEQNISPPLLGVAWDGTGFGLDQTIWGGEFFWVEKDYRFKRIAHFRPFSLPCGDRAIMEPRLSALGILWEIFGESAFTQRKIESIKTFSHWEISNFKNMLAAKFRVPICNSAGRIFDAVSSLMAIHHTITFEGQAAMALEFLSEQCDCQEVYDVAIGNAGLSIDWEPMFKQIIYDVESAKPKIEIAAKFHNTLAFIVVRVAQRQKAKKVVLSGGSFQNKVLTENTIAALQRANIKAFSHRDIPPNDGGISLGQIYSLKGVSLCA